ncbi:MAG: 2-C-methyl-D-erythritol 4-phosphate cytidylyltransferase [Chloroflexota bacterium]|nr:2-C-methyl-D-erythritol 4-phosphate cytidylyltransferase [Chloroflexota bacterium]
MLNRTGVGVVVVAAGSSTRMEGVDKTFAPLLGRPLITHTLDRFEEFPGVSEVVLVLAAHSVEYGRSLVDERGYRKVSHICGGGTRRQDSVKAGLSALAPCHWVMVHDGARPGLDLALMHRGMGAVTASPQGAAIAGVPVKDTIKVVDVDGTVTDTPARETLWAAQTPQIFDYELLCRVHAEFEGDATDDAMMVEALGCKVSMFLGSYENLKVTTPEDLMVMEAVLRGRV